VSWSDGGGDEYFDDYRVLSGYVDLDGVHEQEIKWVKPCKHTEAAEANIDAPFGFDDDALHELEADLVELMVEEEGAEEDGLANEDEVAEDLAADPEVAVDEEGEVLEPPPSEEEGASDGELEDLAGLAEELNDFRIAVVDAVRGQLVVLRDALERARSVRDAPLAKSMVSLIVDGDWGSGVNTGSGPGHTGPGRAESDGRAETP